jgi:tRNA threonylcarbamoyl adenosine modification protein YjeE
MKSIQTKPLNLEQSEKLCELIANHLQEGDVITLSGELGAGKTTLVSNIAKHLQLQPGFQVSSPTYVIHHIYEAKFPIHHIDLYRLENENAVVHLGFEEFLGQRGIAFIEWFEKFPNLWKENRIRIDIRMPNITHRTYEFTFEGSKIPEHWNKMSKSLSAI